MQISYLTSARRQMLLAWIVFGAMAGGCQVSEPILMIEACILPAIESARSSKRDAEVKCQFESERLFVALPAPLPTQSELLAAGVPEDPAASLAERNDDRNGWCTVTQTPPPAPRLKPGWEIACTASSIDIPTLFVASGKSIVMRVAPLPDGTVRLTEMKPF